MSETTKAPRRRPVAGHAKLSSPSRWGQLARFVGVGLSVVLVSGLGVFGYQTVSAVTAFSGNAVPLEGQENVPPDIGEIEGGVNLFVAGTDACEEEYAELFGDRCTGADSGGELNDVNLLVHISDEPRKVTVISFPRDLMLPIPECTDPETGDTTSAMSKEQLNATFTYGGLACSVKTISELTGMDIPFAASVNWGGVIEITNAVGGVEVCIAGGIYDPHTGIDWPAGMRNVVGLDALQFLRTRHGVGNGSDLGRISNQQQYMAKLARKLVGDEVLSNPTTLYNLALTGLQNVQTSESLSNPLTLVQIALAVKNVPFEEIVFLQYPVYSDPSDPNRVVPNYESADILWAALATNQPLAFDPAANAGSGVVPTTPEDGSTAAPVAPPADAIVLPGDISGSTAAMDTCSNGNLTGTEQEG